MRADGERRRGLPPGVVPEAPGPGQESAWDYPRPPVVQSSREAIIVVLGGIPIMQTRRPLRVLETSHPPTYYIPMADVNRGVLQPGEGMSRCEYKGMATYLDVVSGPDGHPVVARSAAWTYLEPAAGYEMLRNHVGVYPGRMDIVLLDGQIVEPQEGGFYAGWVTPRVVGPFKGGPGTQGW